jgi:hypothetical protein
MSKQKYSDIPAALCNWSTFLAQALPIRSVPTFLELLFGAMLTQTGFVSEAWLAIDARRKWFSYYKWLEKGKWSWLALGRQMARLIAQQFGVEHVFLVIDDVLVPRASRRAPGVCRHHQHGNKPNRPRYMWGQTWVCLSVVIEQGWASWTVPLLSRLTRTEGNTTKLTIARVLLRAIRGIFPEATLLVDCWYMRGNLILPLLEQGLNIIGQVRKDTALYTLPVQTEGAGRPRTYGEKCTPEFVQRKFRAHRVYLHVYGKKQWLYYRSAIVRARFLKGREVRAVWVQFKDDAGNLSTARLLLATDTNLTAVQVIMNYAKRWATEPMFNQLKHRWGWQQTWQRSRQVLHRWVQIILVAYALPLLLSLKASDEIQGLIHFAPWRKNQPVTAGRVRFGLLRYLGQVKISDWWNAKSRKFGPPNAGACYSDDLAQAGGT